MEHCIPLRPKHIVPGNVIMFVDDDVPQYNMMTRTYETTTIVFSWMIVCVKRMIKGRRHALSQNKFTNTSPVTWKVTLVRFFGNSDDMQVQAIKNLVIENTNEGMAAWLLFTPTCETLAKLRLREANSDPNNGPV